MEWDSWITSVLWSSLVATSWAHATEWKTQDQQHKSVSFLKLLGKSIFQGGNHYQCVQHMKAHSFRLKIPTKGDNNAEYF